MSSDVAIPLISALTSGGFALLGAALVQSAASRRERTAFRTETALELAGMERMVWGDNWIELQAHLQRLQARLARDDVPAELIQAFDEISVACWSYLRLQRELGQEQPGISSTLLGARKDVHRAVSAYLLGEGGRSVKEHLRAKATHSVREALEPPPHER